MNKKLLKLTQRRERLILQAAEQRAQLAQAVDAWRAPLALADQGLVLISFIKQHPILMAGGGAVLMKLLRKSFIGKWFGRGLMAWQLVRKLQSGFFA
jgi:sorbitol-specific phosphotransferase system component IIBC